ARDRARDHRRGRKIRAALSSRPGRLRLGGTKTMLLSLVFAGTGMLLAPATSRSAPPQDPMPSTMVTTPSITPFLWFDDDAEQAIELYTGLFPGSRIRSQARWGPGGPVPEGTLMS